METVSIGHRISWNRGKLRGQKPPLKIKDSSPPYFKGAHHTGSHAIVD